MKGCRLMSWSSLSESSANPIFKGIKEASFFVVVSFFFVVYICVSTSHILFFVTPWTVIHQALCPRNSPGNNAECVVISDSKGFSQSKDESASLASPTMADEFFTILPPGKPSDR